ncbi:MAG: tRNA 2-thiouridine(34) synthase MnmA [Spirochaetota bacterium]
MNIAVGLSGGVDSSVAALLLKNAGHSITGVTMRIYSPDIPIPAGNACYGPDEDHDVAEASALCKKLGVPYHEIDLREEYKREVLSYFEREYRAGRTPNPCVRCNALVKFGFLISRSREMGISFEKFATGHYARTEYDEAHRQWLLLKAVDAKRDQSYFLGFLGQDQIASVLFPLGAMTKDEVRAIARENGLAAAAKKDSQDFAGGDYAKLIGGTSKKGVIRHVNGSELGMHDGIEHYTVGQRRGLKIAYASPLYVVKIDADTNTVFVGDDADLLRDSCIVRNVNWILQKVDTPTHVTVKIRSAHAGIGAAIAPEGDAVRVTFDEHERAVTPGQAAVFYDGNIVLGAGIID